MLRYGSIPSDISIGPLESIRLNAAGTAFEVFQAQVAGNYVLTSALSDYALVGHDHTGVYQPIGSYSLTTHDHSGVYQPIGSYALVSDLASYATVVALNTAISDLVSAAPATLDTLKELADALGDDPNFATTVSTAIGLKATNTAVVHNTGDETIAGVKTITDSMVFLQQIQRTVAGTLYLNASDAAGEIRIRVNGGDRATFLPTGAVSIPGVITTNGALTTSLTTITNGTSHWFLKNGTLNRFNIGLNQDESSGNAGSDFRINTFDDAGNYLGNSFNIKRSTGNVGIGGLASVESAILQLHSTTKGFLPPRMTTTQRNAISSPEAGLHIENTTTNKYERYTGSAWVGLVDNVNSETVGGIKTFTSSPIVPTPTTDSQAATKKYVDDNVGTIPDATNLIKGKIKLAGDLGGDADSPTVPGLANKVDKAVGKGLSTEDYTSAEKSKLADIEAGAQVNQVNEAPIDGKTYGRKDATWSEIVATGVASVTGTMVDNTNPLNPIILSDSTKVDKEVGKGLSTEDYTTTEKNKLAGIEAGAEVNNISDINATDLTDGGDTELHHHDGRYYTESEIDTLLLSKQDTLVSGTNIKSLNGQSLLGSGDLEITSGGGGNLNYIAVTSNQSISPSNFYGVTCTTSDITLTLADGTSIGENLSIKKLDNTPYTITITGNIEYETSIIMDTQYESLDLYWNGTYYLIK